MSSFDFTDKKSFVKKINVNTSNKYDTNYNSDSNSDTDSVSVNEEASENVKLLLKALDNDTNEGIMKLNKAKIHNMKVRILKELHFNREEIIGYLKRLVDYRYVDDLSDIRYGAHIAWFNLKKTLDTGIVKLSKAASVMDIKITKKGAIVICKFLPYNSIFSISFDNCIIFQKLTDQERILLQVIEQIKK